MKWRICCVESIHSIGLLHRGNWKAHLSIKHICRRLPYFDRFRLCFNEWPKNMHISLAVEKLLKLFCATAWRSIFVLYMPELTRLSKSLISSNYLMLLMVGALTPFLLAFEEREKTCKFLVNKYLELRMHAAFSSTWWCKVKTFTMNLLTNIYWILCTFYLKF